MSRRATLRHRLLLFPLLSLAGLAVLQVSNTTIFRAISRNVIMPNLEQVMLDGHKSAIKSLVDAEAQTLAARLAPLSTREDKLRAIVEQTDSIRFFEDKSGYFFSYDMSGTRINVPTDKSKNGQNLITSVDKKGNLLIKGLVDSARSGGGYTFYFFDKPGKGVQPKLAYAAPIPGTDFLVGTGVYIDDIEAEKARLNDGMARSVAHYYVAIGGVFVVIIFAIAAVALLLSKSVATTVRRSVEQLLSASEQVAAASRQLSAQSLNLAEGATEQASTIQQTSESLKEISGATSRNSDSAAKADQSAREALSAANRGAEDVREMLDTIHSIDAASSDISKIVKTIDEISFQTNILALNAAIEAARSGEHGLGFAVVADQVRSLAQRSADAARETTEKIAGAVARSATGVNLSQDASASLHEIVAQVGDVARIAEEVAAASHRQATAITQFESALDQINQITQRNAANAEESAAAAHELDSQTATVRKGVFELMAFVGGEAASLRSVGNTFYS